LGALAALIASCALAPLAEATFPGKNGKIVFSSYRGNSEIWVMNPDGSGQTQLTNTSNWESDPAWSPDGSRIAFARYSNSGFMIPSLYIMNADGSQRTLISTGSCGGIFQTIVNISWSPDGSRIAVGCNWDDDRAQGNRVIVMDSDGQNRTVVTENGLYPDWSPDGRTLAYYSDQGNLELLDLDSGATTPVPNPAGQFLNHPSWSPDNALLAASDRGDWCVTCPLLTIRPDGSDATAIQPQGRQPSWSPDGSRIAFVDGTEIHTVRPDGTGRQLLGDAAAGTDREPDWQPLPINAYPRPRSATGVDVSLVPAYNPCTPPNRQHGPPLAFGSCNPPVKTSDVATVGTPDANGKPAKGQGVARYAAVGGDVRITFEAYDVYDHPTLADYTGELRVRSTLRITDKRNTPHPGGPGAGTVSDASLGATVPCTATGDTTTGSSCLLTTTANAIAPGTVTAGARSVWELGQVQVDDGGPDGDADLPGENTLFLVQGVFVP
jgi:TolB protein